MSDKQTQESGNRRRTGRAGNGLVRLGFWLSLPWLAVLVVAAARLLPADGLARAGFLTVLVVLAPLPTVFCWLRERGGLRDQAEAARETAEQLKLQMDTVRFRTGRLREELQAADRQARLSHQLTLLGQFTAGFMHEFNNPLAIVAGRIEVLLDERQGDSELCADLIQMQKETLYMSRIASTLLQALRRERGGEVFEPANPSKAVADVVTALRPQAEQQGIHVVEEIGDAPKVDVPEHVVCEVVRGLLNNALQALQGLPGATAWVRIEPYRTAGVRMVIRVEDNGPGVPVAIRDHLFEPFVSHGPGRERLGLGLFLAASLLDMYDGRIRYETSSAGGASFVVELPPARFSGGQPYHWFVGGSSE